MSTTTLLIILGVLVLLLVIYMRTKKNSANSEEQKELNHQPETVVRSTSTNEIQGEVLSAIFMALHEEQEEIHDIEHTVLTFTQSDRNYSQWNSRYFGLRELPRR